MKRMYNLGLILVILLINISNISTRYNYTVNINFISNECLFSRCIDNHPEHMMSHPAQFSLTIQNGLLVWVPDQGTHLYEAHYDNKYLNCLKIFK